MNILLTNDDGINAEGLWALYRRFSGSNKVVVIAPDRERSGVGHGITLLEPLRAQKLSLNNGYSGYAVSGTPVDCIKLGFNKILKCMPDLVISGINNGENIGANINYSGTVAAAKEAALCGVPAMSVSIQNNSGKLDEASLFIQTLAQKIFEKGWPAGTFLNVNIPGMPKNKIAGVRISKLAGGMFPERIEERVDPRNRTYYWQGPQEPVSFENPEIDGEALNENYISVTPIKCDMTDYQVINDLKKWRIHKGF